MKNFVLHAQEPLRRVISEIVELVELKCFESAVPFWVEVTRVH